MTDPARCDALAWPWPPRVRREHYEGFCLCVRDPDHDSPHICRYEECGGSWTGDWDAADFVVVAFPRWLASLAEP